MLTTGTGEVLPIINSDGGPKFDVDLQFKTANKVKSILAKHIKDVVSDTTILTKMLLDTLEGTQALAPDSMVCIGAANDVWQQTRDKLLAKYDVTAIDNNGWLTCSPKPGVPVNAAQVTEEMLAGAYRFGLQAQWGEEIEGEYFQYGGVGDYICQNPEDPDDLWIVRKGMFESTYEFV